MHYERQGRFIIGMKPACNYRFFHKTTALYLGLILLLLLYAVIFYLQYHHQILVDFSSLYFSSQALSQGDNPYQVFSPAFFSIEHKLPYNLNPPVVLWLFQIFLPLGYNKAFIAWTVLSSIAGIKAADITYTIIKEQQAIFITKRVYFLIYFSFFPVLMNSLNSQFGFIVACFILLGYQYSTQNKPIQAGFVWGIIAALKLFPLLLLVFALLNRQIKLSLVFFCAFLTLFFLPVWMDGVNNYCIYYKLLHRILWYGDNWNASLYGLLFRIFADPIHSQLHQLIYIKAAYYCLFLLGFISYFLRSKSFIKQKNPLAAFNLTLAMMLFLSPLAWLYYLPILLLPCILLWSELQSGCTRINRFACIRAYSAFIFLACPIVYIWSFNMSNVLLRLTVFSCHFYGLFLLIIALFNPLHYSNPSYSQKDLLILNRLLFGVITLGMLITIYSMLRFAAKG